MKGIICHFHLDTYATHAHNPPAQMKKIQFVKFVVKKCNRRSRIYLKIYVLYILLIDNLYGRGR